MFGRRSRPASTHLDAGSLNASNFATIRELFHARLQQDFTQADLDWLFAHGWRPDPVEYLRS